MHCFTTASSHRQAACLTLGWVDLVRLQNTSASPILKWSFMSLMSEASLMKLSSRFLLCGRQRQREPTARAALSLSRMLVLEDLMRASRRWRRESLLSPARGERTAPAGS